MLKMMARKYYQFYDEKFCLAKLLVLIIYTFPKLKKSCLKILLLLTDTIFSHYGSHGDTSCPPSYAIATNPNDDDHQGPMFVTTTKTDNVEAGYEFWINRPNIG